MHVLLSERLSCRLKAISSFYASLRNERGQTLIQVLISLGLMGLIMAAFASMVSIQQRQSTQLAEKMARLDLERYVSSVLADGSVCSYLLTQPVSPSFSAMAVAGGGGPAFPNLTAIPVTADPTSLPAITADGKTPASTMNANLVVTSITVEDFKCATPCAPTTSQFLANITLNYDNSKLTMPAPPTKFPIIVNTVPVGAMQTIAGCALSTGTMTPQQICTQLLGYTYNAATTPPCILSSPSKDQYAAICKIMGGTWTGASCDLSTVFGCNVTFAMAKNTWRSLEGLVNLALDESFHTSVGYVARIRELLEMKDPRELTTYLYFLVGVDSRNRGEVVDFLVSSKNEQQKLERFISTSSANFHIDRESARRLVTMLAREMRGELAIAL